MNTCETRGLNPDYEDKNRHAEYITAQTMSIVGEMVEDYFWDSETPNFRVLCSKSHMLFSACAGPYCVVRQEQWFQAVLKSSGKSECTLDDSAGRL